MTSEKFLFSIRTSITCGGPEDARAARPLDATTAPTNKAAAQDQTKVFEPKDRNGCESGDASFRAFVSTRCITPPRRGYVRQRTRTTTGSLLGFALFRLATKSGRSSTISIEDSGCPSRLPRCSGLVGQIPWSTGRVTSPRAYSLGQADRVFRR